MKVLHSGSRLLDSGFQLSGFRNPYHSGFRIPYHSGFRIPSHCGFRIPVLWIPDSNSKHLLDSRFRILLHGARRSTLCSVLVHRLCSLVVFVDSFRPILINSAFPAQLAHASCSFIHSKFEL